MMEKDKRAQVEIAPYDSLVGGRVLVPDHVRKIADLVAAGRDQEKLAIGFHGTSLAALGVAMETGYIPTGRSQKCEGHLYFFPTSHAPVNREGLEPPNAPLRTPTERDKEAFREAEGYAHDLTRAALTANSLGLDLSDDLDWKIAMHIEDIANGQLEAKPGTVDDDVKRIKERLDEKQLSPRALSRLDRQLENPEFDRGFVLLIAKSALEEHSHHLGDPLYGDLKLHLPPEGLSLEHLVGIEPISEADFEVIEKLEKRHCSGN
jgi:hypothetical protein